MMWLVISLMNFISSLIFPAISISLPVLIETAHVWEALSPATCMPDHCFCEPVTDGLIRQPINTWSNLAFILAGTLTIIIAVCNFVGQDSNHKTDNPMRSQWIYPAIYGYTAVLIGLGSMFYHASMAFYGQVIDILGMYLLSTFMALYNLSRLRKMKNIVFFALYLVINITLGYLSIIQPEFRRHIFIGILATILLTELAVYLGKRTQIHMKWMLSAFISLFIACTAWLLDTTGTVCLSNSWVQLHSLWHIGMAGAILFLYLYYQSETDKAGAIHKINPTTVKCVNLPDHSL